MNEEDARRMLMEKLEQAYLMGHGDGLSGGMKSKKRVEAGKKAVEKNKWVHCLPVLRKKHPKQKLGVYAKDYYKKDGGFDDCLKKKEKKKRKKAEKKAGVLIDQFYGNGLSGGVYLDSSYGMGSKRSGRKKAARNNPWINALKDYQLQHGVSYKQAMMALSGRSY
jgi:hypothetical protein